MVIILYDGLIDRFPWWSSEIKSRYDFQMNMCSISSSDNAQYPKKRFEKKEKIAVIFPQEAI